MDAAAYLGEAEPAVDAVVEEGGPFFPPVDDFFNFGLKYAGSGDGDFVVVVGALVVGHDCDELAGSVEDARVFRRCPVAPKLQLKGRPSSPRKSQASA